MNINYLSNIAQKPLISTVMCQINPLNVLECVDTQEMENMDDGILCFIHTIIRTQFYIDFSHVFMVNATGGWIFIFSVLFTVL